MGVVEQVDNLEKSRILCIFPIIYIIQYDPILSDLIHARYLSILG